MPAAMSTSKGSVVRVVVSFLCEHLICLIYMPSLPWMEKGRILEGAEVQNALVLILTIDTSCYPPVTAAWVCMEVVLRVAILIQSKSVHAFLRLEI